MEDNCVIRRLGRHVQAQPQSIAVSWPGGEFTYREFDGLTDQGALSLLTAGVTRYDRVLVLGKRVADLPLAVISLLKVGTVFAIIDPANPERRLVEMTKAFAPTVTVELFEPKDEFDRHLTTACRIRLRQWNRASIPDSIPVIATGERHPPIARAPGDLVYAVFTSGTTGEPKVTGAPWRALLNFLEWQSSEFSLGPLDRFSMFSGLGYDPLIRDLLTPFWCGGTLCVPPESGILSEDAARWTEDQGITVIHWTPSMCELFAAGPTTPLPRLRWAFFGGEPLKGRHVRLVKSLAEQVRCVNVYGTSETPQVVAYHIAGADLSAQDDASVPIGRPIAGITIDLVNPDRTPCEAGQWGELAVSTAYLSHGYLNDARLSDERFEPSGAECYSTHFTGDLARLRADGMLEIAGRRDRQVKLRGQRIELGEIERALRTNTGATSACAAVLANDAGEELLIGYIAQSHPASDPASVRASLADILPAGMIPSHIVFLERLPLSQSGKVDVAALPRISNLVADRASPAMSEEEQAIAQIWSAMLHLETIRLDDNFFMLGGFSMLAVRMLKRVQERFSVSLPVSAILQWPTLSAFAGGVAGLRAQART